MTTIPALGWGTIFFRNRYLLVLAISIILVSGLSALFSLPRLEDPRIVNRNPILITQVPGASSERVEALVTEVLEHALQEVEEIKKLESTSSTGVSVIAIELADSVTAQSARVIVSEIRDKVNEARPLLPMQAGEPTLDNERDPAAFTLILAVRWAADTQVQYGILNRIAQDLSDTLRNVPGTELVRLYGAPEEEITVTIDPAELAELSLDTAGVAQLIASADTKAPAGIIRGARSDLAIEVEGELSTLSRIADIPLTTGENLQKLRLGDIAQIRKDVRDPPTEIALADGERVILVAARIGFGPRADLWAQDAERALETYREKLGEGITIDAVFEQEKYTSDQLSNLVSNLIAGALVVMVVVLFMMGWRLAMIVGFALPLVVSMVLFGLQLSGNAIQQMSIFGLIIALGLLIDNAIVMANEVARNKAAGMQALEAVSAAVRHLFTPLFASTLTTVLAFAPIMLLPGAVGDFVSTIGLSVILALISSFLVAMTVTAGLAGIFAKPPAEGKSSKFWRDGVNWPSVTSRYRRGLMLASRRPFLAILAALALPFAGFGAATQLGNEFFPSVDRNMFEIELWAPSDSSIANTRVLVEKIEEQIRQDGAVEHVDWLVGGSFPSVYYNLVMDQDQSDFYAHGIITTRSDSEARAMIAPLQRILDDQFPGAQIVLGQFGQGPPLAADIEYRIFGPDIGRLQDLGDAIRLKLQSHREVLHTRATMERGEPKLWFAADEDDARMAGLPLADLAAQLQGNLEGGTGGIVVENLEQLPVRVRYDNAHRSSLSAIASAPVVSANSEDWTPLNALGSFELRPQLRSVTRYNSERTNIIRAYTAHGALPIDIAQDVLAEFEAENGVLAAGYRIELGGAVEDDAAARKSLLTYAPILFTIMIATLILAFQSARIAALLFVVAFFSAGLGLLSTFAIGLPISFNTILGTLGLVGLAFNNAIIVLAAIRADPAAKAGDKPAIVSAVIDTSRHILSTTLTTIGGFLPLLLFTGGDFWPALAIVLAGGVSGSMILALLFVPAVYLLITGRPDNDAAEQVAILEPTQENGVRS